MASIRSQQASSSTSPCTYHVFLSFRGEDTRKTFTDHLYTALNCAGFRTFRDDDGIERGENIKSEMQKAIQESRISIVVLSKNYASSSWCLDELVMILKCKSTSGHVVLPVFYDVDPSQVRKQMGSFEEAFTQHEGKIEAYQIGEMRKEWMSKVEEWRAALKEVADLAGMNLKNRADGHESRFIQKIVKVVADKLSRAILDIAPYPIGIHSRAREIQFWLGDDSADVGVAAICGMGGIGKTTIAKFLYNLTFSRFEGSSFLANVREISKERDGLLRLQRQLLSDILKGRKEKIYNVDEGIVKIKDVLCFKRVLVVLDDVDKVDQLEAVLGMRDWLFSGSKIIITTRHERLLRAHEVCKVHRIQKLDYNESIELFSLHAFGQNHPTDEYADSSKWVVNHCGGLPLAIKVLGSSLSGKSLEVWNSQIEKLKAIPDSGILERLKISYDCLQDDHDKSLFLHLACFFVGSDKDCTVTILDGCEFYTAVGIQNLMDRYLVRVDRNKVMMHCLLQEMGREIVRQESPKEPGERSRLWNPKDSFNVLRQNTGTRKIEGLSLDMSLLKEDISATGVVDLNKKRSFEEFFENSLLSDVGNSLKRYCFGIFFRSSIGIASVDSNQTVLETDAFANMHNLKLLQLGHVQVLGSYENFPKEIRWLCWHGFPFESIPSYFPLETLVALEIPHSNLKKFLDRTKISEEVQLKRTKFLPWMKILDLSHSYYLAKTPDFSGLPKLERLMLENCASLNEVHESIGHLERLVLLNLKDCKNLRILPRSIGMLKLLEKFDISGCSNLDKLPAEIRNMVSLKVLHANETSILSTVGDENEIQSFIRPWLWKPKKSPETSWASFPWSLVKLSLRHCNLSEDAFPRDITNLSSLNFLDLSCNPIRSVPHCIKDLNLLQSLYVNNCCSLRRLLVKLNNLAIGRNCLLEKITFPLASHRPKCISCPGKINKLYEFTTFFKLQPIGNVNAQLLNHMGLSNWEFLGNPIMELTAVPSTGQMKLTVQGCQEAQIFCIFFSGSKVPPWFTFTSTGSLISFIVPSHLNSRIRGLSVCALYGQVLLSYEYYVSSFAELFIDARTIVNNTSKGLIWGHRPSVFGFPEAGEDMIWLSSWNFENRIEAGDEINISVIGAKLFQVKEIGVHIVYEEQEKTITHIESTSEEEKESQILHGFRGSVHMMKYFSDFR